MKSRLFLFVSLALAFPMGESWATHFSVHPILEFVCKKGENSYTAHFGYYNRNKRAVKIPVGACNGFRNTPNRNMGQPITFNPGRANDVFQVDFDGRRIVWNLNGHSVAAASDQGTKTCTVAPTLLPIVDFVCGNKDSTFSAHFGYHNLQSVPMDVPVGPENGLSGAIAGANGGQPVSFNPGRAFDVFSVKFNGADLHWTLKGNKVTAKGANTATACQTPQEPVKPILELVCKNPGSTYTAHFGYMNSNDAEIPVPIGPDNRVSGFMGGDDHGQPDSFKRGRVFDAFQVEFDGNELNWTLRGNVVTAVGAPGQSACSELNQAITPILEYVCREADGTFDAHFGYQNPNSKSTAVPIGAENGFSGTGAVENLGQPTVFLPGRVADRFHANFGDEDLIWTLNGQQVVANGSTATEDCNHKVFVSPTGDDATGNGSEAKPYRSLGAAYGDIGSAAGTILLMDGTYQLPSTVFAYRPDARKSGVEIRPSGAKENVLLASEKAEEFFLKIDDANVRLTDLRIRSSCKEAIRIGPHGSGFQLENCLLDGSLSGDDQSSAIKVLANGAVFPIGINIKDNVILGGKRAVMEISGRVDVLHFIHNTSHMQPGSHGLRVDADGYSGVVVDDNIFIYGPNYLPTPSLNFIGKGKGVRINLNCFNTPTELEAAVISNRFHSKSLSGVDIPFTPFSPEVPASGLSTRGPCFDIYSQEKLGEMKP